MHIIAVIPTHNRKNYLRNLLNSLANQNTSAKLSKVVVVDGSTDGTIEMLKESFPEVIIVKGDGNWWYTKSMNEGFKKALEYSPNFILTLNDDIELGSNYIQNLLNAHKRIPEKSILGSISFVKGEKNIVYTCGSYYKSRFTKSIKSYKPHFTYINDSETKGIIKPSVTLPGRGILIPKETLMGLGGFDEKFVQYHSDGDFCMRARKKGFPVYISWDAKIYVNVKQTSNSSSFIKSSLKQLIKDFFYNNSRIYIPTRALLLWRHKNKLLWPYFFTVFLFSTIKNNFSKHKLG